MKSSVDDVLKALGFTGAQIKQVHDGTLVKETVTAETDRELGVRLACRVNAKVLDLKKTFLTDPELKEVDSTTIAMGLIDDANPDFSGVKLDAAMVQAYLNAAPGPDLNLSKSEIEGFHQVKKQGGKEAEVEKQLRTVLLERYQSYRQHGLAGILPYTRKGGKDFHPEDDLKKWGELMKELKKESPKFYEVMNDYPNARPEGLEESFFWLSSLIDNKTTVCLVHHFALLEDDSYVFCERQFYVGRSHNSVQGIGGAWPVGDKETIVSYCTRTSTDQVAGFGGGSKRTMGSKVMSGRVAANFEKARSSISSKADSK